MKTTDKELHTESELGSTPAKYIKTGIVKIYQVKEYELDELGKGNQADIYLNFAIACSSVFFSFLASLLSLNISQNTAFYIFVCITIISFLASTVLFTLWWNQKKSKEDILRKIKANEST